MQQFLCEVDARAYCGRFFDSAENVLRDLREVLTTFGSRARRQLLFRNSCTAREGRELRIQTRSDNRRVNYSGVASKSQSNEAWRNGQHA